MKQTARIISTYSADVFGVCSALFELGGMTVMHDASGCNSTYTTHDEPRWYDMDSMVYISGLSEMEAIMGDDDKLIRDIADAAGSLHPKFIALAGTPVPAMTGFDYEAVAAVIEQETGIPSFGFPTTGMNTYIHGASMALAGIAERFVRERKAGEKKTGTDAGSDADPISVNILGLTPLDFSVNGTDRSIASFLERSGFRVNSRWAMGADLEELSRAADADVSLVVSAAGLGAAHVLKRRFGIPFVAGLPLGDRLGRLLCAALRSAAAFGDDKVCGSSLESKGVVLIGEGITSLALASAIELETGKGTKVLCATECEPGILREKDTLTPDEDDIIPELKGAQIIIADPLYRPICPPEAKFIEAPSEAFSGRIYRQEIIDPVSDLYKLLEEVL